ncbi:MAG: sodium:proton antiporter [Candidatus Nomurabacteria bacterium]|nr:MAG: sodium:proton antiporter [Candidatus Nomurabacteria bacterium]
MLTIGTTLAIFLMLGISSLALFWAKRLNIPHTVFLVFIGIGLGFLSLLDPFSFIEEFQLTPELLFYLLLPTLIFESAYNMNIRKLVADSTAVLSLAIGSFLISTILIAGLLHIGLGFIGISMPFTLALLFGALISATDPVAVLALFKEYGVPRRLSLIFEGESLFNDATAVALFLITLEVIKSGGVTIFTTLSGSFTFLSMLVFGVIFGILVGGIFAYLVGKSRDSEVASITLTIVLAHITFILAEVVSEVHWFGEFQIHISPIISTTIASLLMGNYGRTKMNPHAESIVTNIWEQFAFMANSLIFILIGVLMFQTPLFDPLMLSAIAITVLVVASARAISIYPVVGLYNLFQTKARRIPQTWQHLLAWGSLRGALAVTMVFLIPEDLALPGWNLDISPRDFLLSLTIGCIAVTLFVKATTIKHFVRRFKLDSFTAVEEIEYQEAQALIHHQVTNRLETYESRGYIDAAIGSQLRAEHDAAFKRACKQASTLNNETRNDLAFRVLRIYAIGIEKRHLKLLFIHNEVTERVYRRIVGKLRLQLEAIESGNLSPDLTIHADGRDIFDRLFITIKNLFGFKDTKHSFPELYMYYRAQSIISRKVLKELAQLEKVSGNIFTHEAVAHVYELYTEFRENSEKKLQDHSANNQVAADKLAISLARHGVHTIEENVLEEIFKKELITPKLYITLKEELGVIKD